MDISTSDSDHKCLKEALNADDSSRIAPCSNSSDTFVGANHDCLPQTSSKEKATSNSYVACLEMPQNGIESPQILSSDLELSESITRPSASKTINSEGLDSKKESCSFNINCGTDSIASTESKDILKHLKLHTKEKTHVGKDNPVEVLNEPRKVQKQKVLTKSIPAKRKQLSVTYQSQISPDQKGIKLFIKKSSGTARHTAKMKKHAVKRKYKKGATKVNDGSEDRKIKRVRWKEVEESELCGKKEEQGQSDWGLRLPVTALHKIFLMVTYEEGCLPFLSRAGKVCRLWREVAIMPSLWHNIDLSGPWYKDKCKNSIHLKRLCENRLSRVKDLNLSGWKIPAIQDVLANISESCGELRGLNLTGWKSLSGEHLKFLITDCPLLSRVDLSSICPEIVNNKGALSLMSLTNLAQMLGGRLTQLLLANNRLCGLPQIVTALATYCPNLEVLDLSNMKTGSVTTAPFHIEKLQWGCQKLRVLRITNSQIALSQTPLKEQAASPGFPLLEELSVAGIGVDGLCSTPIIDDNSVERILKSSHKLRLLDARGCTRITDSSLVKIPAWDLEHLFLSGCYVTRLQGNGLELIAQKWSHSLIEMDLAWSTAIGALDMAVSALAECEVVSPLRVLNLCGSSVSLEPVVKVLRKCPHLVSLNLSSCRALPRGIKRLYVGNEVNTLRISLEKSEVTPVNVEDVEEKRLPDDATEANDQLETVDNSILEGSSEPTGI